MKKLLFGLLLFLPASAFAVKVVSGSFASNTATGNQTIDTGVDSVLKAIRFYGTRQTATGLADVQSGFHGMAVSSTARKVLAWASDDNVATSNTGKKSANLAICILSDGTPTVDGEADFVSFGTGGNAGQFTVNWTDAPASAYLIYYEAYYGDALSNAAVTEHTISAAVGSDQAFTGVGFQPNFIFLMSSNQTSLVAAAGAGVGFGMATGTSNQAALTAAAPDADGAGGYNARSYQSDTLAILCYNTALTPALHQAHKFVSFDADGFTLKIRTKATDLTLLWALSFRGGRCEVGSFNSPTAGGTPQDQSVTATFQPNGVSFLSTATTILNATISEFHLGFSFGYDSSGTKKEQYGWTWTDDASGNRQTGMGNNNAKCIFFGAAGSPPTVLAEADYKTQAATSFTVTWTTIDAAVSHKSWFTAFGSPLEECPSGPKSGGTTTPNQFTNPNNVFTSNNVYASEGTPAETMAVYDFGLAPVSGNNIDGILVECEGLCTGASCDIGVDVRLSWNAGVNWTAVKTINPDAVEGYDALGGASDTWGRTWTATELNNPNFRVGIKYANELNGTDGYNLDHVRVTVYCSAAGGAGNIRRQRILRYWEENEKNPFGFVSTVAP